MREKRAIVELDNKLANRSVNEGFSGGEKKRNEIFQMAMLEPTFAILDETDSGLDVDALRIVADGLQQTQDCGNQCYGHYPLPAVVGLYQTRYGTCTAGWTYRKDRWTGIGEGD